MRGNYAIVAEHVTQASDVKNLIDFMLHLLHERRLQNAIIEQRARQFMFKLISKIPVIPLSLVVTGVSNPASMREYIGAGAFGLVFKGELRGSAVALKVLYPGSGNPDVVSSFIAVIASLLDLISCRPFVERRWCGTF